MKKMKKVFAMVTAAIIFIAAIALTQVPIPQAEASASIDFRMDGNKLVKYAGTANTVSVPASVKVIGAEAFANCSFLTGVTLPQGLDAIEYGAFSDCKLLRRITIPASVTKIGREAFSDCEQLNKVVLGKGVMTIDTGAFAGCTSLKTIDVNRENPYFKAEKGVLYNKNKTKLYLMCAGNESDKLVLPSTVISIEPYAFWNCKNLKEISLSGNLKEIQGYSFSNCSGLVTVNLPYSVRQIDVKAFENCINLKNISIPPSVNYIHLTAFDGCNQLQINAEEGTVAGTFAKEWKERKGNESTVSDNQITDIMGSTKEEKTENNTENNTESNTDSINHADNTNNTNNSNGSNHTNSTDSVNSSLTDSQKELGKSIIVSNNAVVLMDNKQQQIYTKGAEKTTEEVKGEAAKQNKDQNKIKEKAFYRESGLTEYEISQEVTEIEKFAFARSGLREIIIPNSVKSIGYAAFYHCDELETVTIPATVTDIASQAFQKTKWMQNFFSSGKEDFLIAGDGILIAYKGSAKEVVIPDTVKKIGGEVFTGHEEIETVTIPSTTTVIGEYAFAGCLHLKTVVGGQNVTNFPESAFAECPVLTTKMANMTK